MIIKSDEVIFASGSKINYTYTVETGHIYLWAWLTYYIELNIPL